MSCVDLNPISNDASGGAGLIDCCDEIPEGVERKAMGKGIMMIVAALRSDLSNGILRK